MDNNYATKSECKFEHLEDKISSKLDMQNQIIMNKLDSINSDIEKSIKLALYEKEEQDRKDRKETNQYIIGTIVIGIAGILVSIVFG